METLKPPKAYWAGHEPEESLRYFESSIDNRTRRGKFLKDG